jgi:hypothetical protein
MRRAVKQEFSLKAREIHTGIKELQFEFIEKLEIARIQFIIWSFYEFQASA